MLRNGVVCDAIVPHITCPCRKVVGAKVAELAAVEEAESTAVVLRQQDAAVLDRR